MNKKSKHKTVIGRTADIAIISEGIKNIPAKIDTGADGSAIWASRLSMTDDYALRYCLFDEQSPFFTGKIHETSDYDTVAVRSAHGTMQIRYRVKITIELAGRRVKGTFTLADRSENTYPILMGCKLLYGKFLVDVSQGDIVRKKHPTDLKNELQKDPKAFFDKYHKHNHRGDC